MGSNKVVEGPIAADLYIQWKGTDLCGDFTCECGWQGHIDQMFVYGIKCGGCEARWIVPWTISLTKLRDDETDSNRIFWTSDDHVTKPEGYEDDGTNEDVAVIK